VKLIHALGALPFLGILVGIVFANRVEPFVLGLPFILFWAVAWVVLTSAIMAVVYVLDPANREDEVE
jgi:lipopolysaccharide export LptBFGC system permease protein LptF